MIGSPNFQQAATESGIRFTALPGDFQVLLGSTTGLELMEGKAAVRLIDNELLRHYLEVGREAIRGCDLLIAPPLARWAYHLAEAEGCRFAVVSPIPVVGTKAFPFLRWPGDPSLNQRSAGLRRRWRGHLHRLSYEAVRLLGWRREAAVTGLPPSTRLTPTSLEGRQGSKTDPTSTSSADRAASVQQASNSAPSRLAHIRQDHRIQLQLSSKSRGLSTTERSPTFFRRQFSAVLCRIRQHDP